MYFYDGSILLTEKVGSQPQKIHINDGIGIIGMVSPIYNKNNTLTHYQRLYYMYDSLGSISVVTGENGLPIQNYTYSPYGSCLNTENDPVNNLRFVGRYGGYRDDDTNLTYFWHRWYDERDGRWVSRDMIKYTLKTCKVVNKRNNVILNTYNYALNNSLLFIDPNGETPFPGYNYCGEGSNFGEEPVNELDAACREHDNCYNKLGLAGAIGVLNPFLDECTREKKKDCDKQLCYKAINFNPTTKREETIQLYIIIIFCWGQ